MPLSETINVNLGDESYDIFLGHEMESFIKDWILRMYPDRKAYVFIDSSVHALYGGKIKGTFENIPHETFSLELGEERKNLEIAESVFGLLLSHECDRESLIVAFGGGVTGDIIGFCAATFMRGIDYVQIPTTLLAQVDSSVGGKTGVNFRDGKNLIGAFHQPRAVFIDIEYLATLDERNIMSGLAEVIKAGFMGDRDIIGILKGRTVAAIRSDHSLLLDLIGKSIRFKVDVISKDVREAGLRKVLNFGHTIGHGIEEAMGYRELLHGEAIITGMAVEGQICALSGSCTEETRNTLIGVLEDLGYDILPEKVDYSNAFSLIRRDKKRVSDTIVIPVIRDVGSFEFKEFQMKDYEKCAIESLNFLKGFKESKLQTKLMAEVYDDIDALEWSGRFNDAENLVGQYLERDPGNLRLTLILGRLKARQEKYVEALEVIEEILHRHPEHEEALSMSREFEEALTATKVAAEDVPGEKPPADTVIEIGDEVFTIEGAEESEGISAPGFEDFIEERVLQDGAPEEARVDFAEEEEIEGSIPVYSLAMAEMLLRENEEEKALDVVREILNRDPRNRSAIELMERITTAKKRDEWLRQYGSILEKLLQKIVEVYK